MNINYNEQLKNIINNIQQEGKKLSLILHCCCAPCASYCIEYLYTYFDIAVYFYNPNIDTEQEYLLRKDELKRFLASQFPNIIIIDEDYRSLDYYTAIQGLESCAEGGNRCIACYDLRLQATATKAKELGLDYFASTLSISPHKNAKIINEIGLKLQDFYGVLHLPNDFKKNNGYLKSCELSKKHNFYRQDYCGCVFSKKRNI